MIFILKFENVYVYKMAVEICTKGVKNILDILQGLFNATNILISLLKCFVRKRRQGKLKWGLENSISASARS